MNSGVFRVPLASGVPVITTGPARGKFSTR